ncbi:uncharacterized protein LOC114255374 [Monomorium pharaonis]|uniref:uncharacterized protein LOC114255374 n=1 Tax=Monomorium pharaonis TaxID=307658 RepID=UPI00102E1E3A|nr:uncharacterized protein LOC114255374 [Monomorium pharaonis]
MKDYICKILLLCGLAHFATQVQGDCQYGAQVFNVGTHTARPCAHVTCDINGGITLLTCARSTCGLHYKIVGYTSIDDSKTYPDCCPQPICELDTTKLQHYYPDSTQNLKRILF